MTSSELDRIRVLSRIFAPERPHGVLLGIGDDAAVLAPSAEPLVWTVDSAVEGVHFRRAWLSFEDIGYRSTMAAVSDLGAMGAEPLGVLSALVLPQDVTDDDLFALARGQKEAAGAVGTAVIGGNLARGTELSITTTALGRAPRPIQRAGARPGDKLWLLGPVGVAAAGLRFLQEGLSTTDSVARERLLDMARERLPDVARERLPDVAQKRLPDMAREQLPDVVDRCVEAWRRPRARIAEGLSLRGIATAAVDVSDGLARDVGHLARASGVRAVIQTALFENMPVEGEGPSAPHREGLSTLQSAAARLGTSPLDLALFGGEDYAIAFTAPPDTSVLGAVAIGIVEAITFVNEASVVLERPDGSREPARAGGFDHFTP